MRRRSHILAVALAMLGVACSLNPQPYPPASLAGDPDAGAGSDAFSPFADAAGGDAAFPGDDSGTILDAGPADGDAGGDATVDSGDAGVEGGPSDAALADGG